MEKERKSLSSQGSEHGVRGRGDEVSENGDSGSGMGLTRTTASTGKTTHFLIQLEVVVEDLRRLVWQLR